MTSEIDPIFVGIRRSKHLWVALDGAAKQADADCLEANKKAARLQAALQGMLNAFGSCKGQQRPAWTDAIQNAENALTHTKGTENARP